MPRRPLTTAEREAISRETRLRMADPAVREKISQRTREGMRRAATKSGELAALIAAWDAARASERGKFLAKALGRLGPEIDAWTAAELAAMRAPIGGTWQRWYSTARWKRLRLRVFVRDRFQCQCGCEAIEGNTSRLVAHHKKPHRGNEHLFWDEANIETVLKVCHDTIKQREEQASLLRRGVWD